MMWDQVHNDPRHYRCRRLRVLAARSQCADTLLTLSVSKEHPVSQNCPQISAPVASFHSFQVLAPGQTLFLTSMRQLLLALTACLIFAQTARADVLYLDPATRSPRATSVTRGADIPTKNWLAGHRGVDLSLTPGAPVYAAGEGVVAFSGIIAGVPVVSVDHPNGIRTTYQPVLTTVRKGEPVRAGDVLGQLGPAARGHDGLHWGALNGPDEYINPLSLLAEPTIRLKPAR